MALVTYFIEVGLLLMAAEVPNEMLFRLPCVFAVGMITVYPLASIFEVDLELRLMFRHYIGG